MPEPLTDALFEAVEQAARDAGNTAFLAALRCGTTDVPAELPDDVRRWFARWNGTEGDALGRMRLMPWFSPASWEEAVAVMEAAERFALEEPELAPDFDSGPLVPVLLDGGGGYLAVATSGPCAGQVFGADFGFEPELAFASLGDLLRYVVEGYRRGVFWVDENAHLEVDHPSALGAELNPGAPYWAQG